MSRPGAVVILALVIAAPAAARADDPSAPPAPRKDHYHQFAIGLQIPTGVRAIITYDKEFCGDRGDNGSANAEACIDRIPFSLDFELAYGIKANLELLLELKLGLERDFGTTSTSSGPRMFQWAPGAKFYFAEGGKSKLFSTAQLAFDHTGYSQADKTDFFLRNVNGLQLDLDPSYGLYFFVGEEVAFRRWFDISVEGGVGIQGRYP
jgi:hypothetical protein